MKWINVNDRLPTEEKSYAVWFGLQGEWAEAIWDNKYKQFCDEYDGKAYMYITFWMDIESPEDL